MTAPDLEGVVEALRYVVSETARIERGEYRPDDVERACMFMRRRSERALAAWDEAQALRAQAAPEPAKPCGHTHEEHLRMIRGEMSGACGYYEGQTCGAEFALATYVGAPYASCTLPRYHRKGHGFDPAHAPGGTQAPE